MKIPGKGDRILPSCQGLRMGAIVHPESATDQANTEAKTAAAAAFRESPFGPLKGIVTTAEADGLAQSEFGIEDQMQKCFLDPLGPGIGRGYRIFSQEQIISLVRVVGIVVAKIPILEMLHAQ